MKTKSFPALSLRKPGQVTARGIVGASPRARRSRRELKRRYERNQAALRRRSSAYHSVLASLTQPRYQEPVEEPRGLTAVILTAPLPRAPAKKMAQSPTLTRHNSIGNSTEANKDPQFVAHECFVDPFEGPFEDTLYDAFPKSERLRNSICRISKLLERDGFTRSNAIPLVSQCRDELCFPTFDVVEKIYGQVFNISALAGMVFCGQTGFLAAEHHSPIDENGKERYIFLAGPHIAIDAQGTIGKIYRRGREKVSGACGSLMAFWGDLKRGKFSVNIDMNDLEQTLVKHACLKHITFGNVPTLHELTMIAHTAVVEQVTNFANITCDKAGDPNFAKQRDYAIVTGVMIHGPCGSNYFWPGSVKTRVDGVMNDRLADLDSVKLEDYKDLLVESGRLTEVFDSIRLGSNAAVGLLLDSLEHPGEGNLDGTTALHVAAEVGNLEAIKTILGKGKPDELGANKDRWDQNAIDVAQIFKHTEVQAFLEETTGIKAKGIASPADLEKEKKGLSKERSSKRRKVDDA